MSRYENSYFTNRTLCDVLEEMRKCYETRNFAYILGLIEEFQSLANRMEAGLGDKKDLIALREERTNLKEEVMKLRKYKNKLKPKRKKKISI